MLDLDGIYLLFFQLTSNKLAQDFLSHFSYDHTNVARPGVPDLSKTVADPLFSKGKFAAWDWPVMPYGPAFLVLHCPLLPSQGVCSECELQS